MQRNKLKSHCNLDSFEAAVGSERWGQQGLSNGWSRAHVPRAGGAPSTGARCTEVVNRLYWLFRWQIRSGLPWYGGSDREGSRMLGLNRVRPWSADPLAQGSRTGQRQVSPDSRLAFRPPIRKPSFALCWPKQALATRLRL